VKAIVETHSNPTIPKRIFLLHCGQNRIYLFDCEILGISKQLDSTPDCPADYLDLAFGFVKTIERPTSRSQPWYPEFHHTDLRSTRRRNFLPSFLGLSNKLCCKQEIQIPEMPRTCPKISAGTHSKSLVMSRYKPQPRRPHEIRARRKGS
jgi:hypothetical protein